MKRFCVLFSPLLALSFLACPSNNTLTTPVSDSFNTLETSKHKTPNPITEEVFWENDGSRGDPNWGSDSVYKFADIAHAQSGVSDILSSDIWERIKIETFYLDFTFNPNPGYLDLAVSNYDLSLVYTGDYITTLDDSHIENLGEGNYRLTIALADDPLVDTLDEKNLLLSGAGYIPQRFFFKTGHACNLELVKGKNPTLLRPGYKNYYVCTVGGEYYEDAEGLIPIADIENWKVNEGKLNPILNMGEFVTIVFFGVAAITWIVFIIIDMKNGFIRLKLSNITYSKKHTDEPKFDEYVVSFNWENRRIHYYIFKEKRLNATLEDVKKEFNRDRHNGKLKRYIRKLIAPVKSK